METLDKPVFILAQGSSIKTLEDYIEQYKDLDVIYASFNRFSTVEPILTKINKYLNIVYCNNIVRMLEEENNIKKYLSLGGDRLLILNPSQINNIEKNPNNDFTYLKQIHNTQIIRQEVTCDNGSMVYMLKTMISLGYKKFIIFGCDGVVSDKPVTKHYKQEEYNNKKERIMDSIGSLRDDTTKLNRGFEGYVNKYNIKYVEIYNCNPNSNVTCFPIIDYNQVKDIYENISV